MVGDEIGRQSGLLTGGFTATKRSSESVKYDMGQWPFTWPQSSGDSWDLHPPGQAKGASSKTLGRGKMHHPHRGDWGQPSLIQETAEQRQWPQSCAQPFPTSPHLALGLRRQVTDWEMDLGSNPELDNPGPVPSLRGPQCSICNMRAWPDPALIDSCDFMTQILAAECGGGAGFPHWPLTHPACQ